MNFIVFLILLGFISQGCSIEPVTDISLYPNTQNSPSLYLIQFTLTNALPTNSYLLVAMDWYTTAVTPYSCILVNTSITTPCTNLASPTFPLTISSSSLTAVNSILSSSKVVVIKLQSNLLPNTTYSLQIQLYNVVPNIKKISPSIQMYAMGSTGLVYQQNPNMGAVINSNPITNLMSVSILNTLSANSPGSTSTLLAQVTIGQAISTALSTFMFVIQYPFTFSLGSIPTTSQSSSYSTNPIALYSSPTIYSYQVLTPNVFMLIFNEQFAVGRKFIIQINQINNPFFIASSNISIYSLNYNTLTPLQAFEMLYPIATVSYPLSMTLGLPYNAPFLDAMRFYQNVNQYIQVSILIPYSVPVNYAICLQLTSATLYQGTAYANFQSLIYTPKYSYNLASNKLTITDMGPIVIGTTIVVTLMIMITTNSLFAVNAYIDTPDIISSFVAASYLYQGIVEGSGVVTSNFNANFYDNIFGNSYRVKSGSNFDAGQLFYLYYNQYIGSTATSAGSYMSMYLPPNVQVASNFDSNTDCMISGNTNSCAISFLQTSTYLKITIQGTTSYLASVPNIFPYNTGRYIYLKNIYFPTASTVKTIYQIYFALYEGNVVNPNTYYQVLTVSADPSEGALSGLSLSYLNNYYTSSPSNYQTYPGVLRFASVASSSQLNLVVQPNYQLVVTFFARYGFRSISTLNNMDAYPCTSNIGITCQLFYGQTNGANQIFWYDQIVVTFTTTEYSTKNFHILIPDMQIAQYENYFWYHIGFYNIVNKDFTYIYSGNYYRTWTSWSSSITSNSNFYADITGKAGAYRNNVTVYVSNTGGKTTGDSSFIILCTQWSLFQNGVSNLSATTFAMSTPATFNGAFDKAPLGFYYASNMYLTVIPFSYVTTAQSTFTFNLDKAHMPYSYDLPNYYIYAIRQSNWFYTSTNSLVMANGGTLYQSPLQSLVVNCADNALGVVNTYCTIIFGTSNPLLKNGYIRLSLSGMTVATNVCYLYDSNGTSILVTCTSSSDNKNVTVAMTGWQFYSTGTYTLVVYGVGISSTSLSQSITLYLYDPGLQFVIETGVRILTTTIAGLSYISLTQITYAYANPLSFNTMNISFYLPRSLYKDEQFAFVIGQDLSDVNTEVSRLKIIIRRQDGVVLTPLYSLDSVNFLIIFSFSDPSQLTAGNYTMTIYGICTPASQSNGAFNMIYRRIYDFAYTIVNNQANVIFPSFQNLVASNISMVSYFNTEGYKQDIIFTLVNTEVNVDSTVIWIINFPSYYSSALFQEDAYCMVNTAVTPCTTDANTPYQLIVTNSPATVMAGTSYTLSVIGLAAPRAIYTNNAYPQRYIFIGVLQNSASTSYSQRNLLSPYQSVQSSVAGVINVQNMVGVSTNSLYAFSSIYAQFQIICNLAINSGYNIFLDLPIQFNNLNNIPINAILLYGSNTISSNTIVVNRKIQITLNNTIPANTAFQVQFPNLPTPISPCTTQMSTMIVTVTTSTKLNLYAASSVYGNSAPRLTFLPNTLYISFNADQSVIVTAGTYTQPISITTSNGVGFLSNINIQLSSTGFTFIPSTVFLPIGQKTASFIIGADSSLVPVTYFYQAIKQQEVNTNYQITLNMNIVVTNNPIVITLPSSVNLPLGGCSNPFIISLNNPPFNDLTITYTFDNVLYSEINLYPNPILTPSQMDFTLTKYNNTFSFCSTSALPITSIPITFHLSGTNFNSYKFSPSNQVTLNVVNNVTNTVPTLSLALNNQQKTFLDINFTNNVDGTIFYEMMIGQSVTPNSLQAIQVYLKSGTWTLATKSDFMSHIYTVDRDNRIQQFFQIASLTTIRINNLVPESQYTLCAFIVNVFGVAGVTNCLNLNTMAWGTVIKAKLSFSTILNAQQLNNVICFFTSAANTNQLYLIDQQGNSCGNRSVVNTNYKYVGSSFITQYSGTNIYLITNPTLVGTDPSPLAFSNLFGVSGSLTPATLSSAQSMFLITFLSANYVTSFNARSMTDSSQTNQLTVYFTTPAYSQYQQKLTVANVQVMGGVGTVYFVLVLYKQIQTNTSSKSTTVNIRMNQPPTAQQVLNCQNWLSQTANGCARAVYTGVSPLTVTFNPVLGNALYLLYYVVASQFPMRPIVSSTVQSLTVVTYSFQLLIEAGGIVVLLLLMI